MAKYDSMAMTPSFPTRPLYAFCDHPSGLKPLKPQGAKPERRKWPGSNAQNPRRTADVSGSYVSAPMPISLLSAPYFVERLKQKRNKEEMKGRCIPTLSSENSLHPVNCPASHPKVK